MCVQKYLDTLNLINYTHENFFTKKPTRCAVNNLQAGKRVYKST